MLWVYGHYKLFTSFSAGTVFRRQILTSKDGPRAEKNLTSKDGPRAERVDRVNLFWCIFYLSMDWLHISYSQPVCSARPNGSICLLVKSADTAVWLCSAAVTPDTATENISGLVHTECHFSCINIHCRSED